MSLMYERFLKRLPHIRIGSSEHNKINQLTFEKIRQATPVVFTSFNSEKIIDPIDVNDLTKINLPFDFCFYEIMNGSILGFHDKSDNMVHVTGIYVEQKTPSQFEILILANNSHYESILSESILSPEIRDTVLNVVYQMTEKFHNEHKGVSSPRTSVKTRNQDGSKQFHRINKVVYVSNKKSAKSFDMEEREIDWSHRWEVRGHWRRIEGLGRDRHDQQIVKGYTWIKNYVKGDASLPLVKKVRFVQ